MTKLAKYLPFLILLLLLVSFGCKKNSNSEKLGMDHLLVATVTATEIKEDTKIIDQQVSADCDCEKDEDQRMWEETEKRLKDRMDCLERSRLSIEKGGEAEWCP